MMWGVCRAVRSNERAKRRVPGLPAKSEFRISTIPNHFCGFEPAVARISPYLSWHQRFEEQPKHEGPVAHIAGRKAKVPRATYLGCPTALPMAPTPANDLTEHICQRAGPAARVDGHSARLRGRSGPSCRHSRMEAVGDATRLGPSEPRRASRKLPTRSAHGERKPGRPPRED